MSVLSDRPALVLPLNYKGVSGFGVQVLGSSSKNDSFGNYKYTVEVRNNSGKIRKTIKVSYILSFQPNIKIAKTLTGHIDNVRSVRFSPDGTKIVSGSSDYNVKIWE